MCSLILPFIGRPRPMPATRRTVTPVMRGLSTCTMATRAPALSPAITAIPSTTMRGRYVPDSKLFGIFFSLLVNGKSNQQD